MLMVIESRQFDNAHQCAAYLALVPVQHESGSSVKGRAHLSKAGNPIIRYNPDIKAQYERLTSKGKSKMSALGTPMRKRVHGVLKHQQPYQPQTG